MTTEQPTATPGWYPNQYGQMQWWDGHQWGAVHNIPTSQLKSAGIAYLLLILLGSFGAHRFYLRHTASAVTMTALWWGGWILTFAGIGIYLLGAVIIWWIIDLFLIPGMTRTTNRM